MNIIFTVVSLKRGADALLSRYCPKTNCEDQVEVLRVASEVPSPALCRPAMVYFHNDVSSFDELQLQGSQFQLKPCIEMNKPVFILLITIQ